MTPVQQRNGRISHHMELLHVHDTSTAVYVRVIVYLSYVAVAWENILLSFILVLILVELFTNEQATNIRVITAFRKSGKLVKLLAEKIDDGAKPSTSRRVARNLIEKWIFL